MLKLIDLPKYRIIDLSPKVCAGILTTDNIYSNPNIVRRCEVRRFIYNGDKSIQTFVDYMETHIGSHVECPMHVDESREDAASMPLEIFMGEAVILDFKDKKALYPITREDLDHGGVKKGDIVLLRSPYESKERPYLTRKAMQWLVDLPIKMLGSQGIAVDKYPTTADGRAHWNVKDGNEGLMILSGIPLIEGINLQGITKKRVFYIGLPLRIVGLDSSWIRAIALEER